MQHSTNFRHSGRKSDRSLDKTKTNYTANTILEQQLRNSHIESSGNLKNERNTKKKYVFTVKNLEGKG